MRRAIFCTSLVLVALGLFGCGSGGSNSSSTHSIGGLTVPSVRTHTGTTTTAAGRTGTTTAPAASSYAGRADAICTRYQQQRRSIFSQLAAAFRPRQHGQQHGGPGFGGLRQKAASAYRQAVASGRREVAELRTLSAPPRQVATAHAYVASVSAVLNDLQRYASRIASGGLRRAASGGGQLPADARRSHQLAQKLGMKTCGQLR